MSMLWQDTKKPDCGAVRLSKRNTLIPVTITDAEPSSISVTADSIIYDGIGPHFELKKIDAGEGIAISDANGILTISSSLEGGGVHTLSSDGAGTSLVTDSTGPTLAIRSLVAGDNINFQINPDDSLTIEGVPSPDVLLNSTLNSDVSLVTDPNGPILEIRGVSSGDGISLTTDVDGNLVISSDPITLDNAGTGISLVASPSGGTGPNLETKGLVGGSNISVTSINADTDVEIAYTGTTASDVNLASTGMGVDLVSGPTGPNLSVKSIEGGTGITVTDNTTFITIDSTVAGAETVTLSNAGVGNSLVAAPGGGTGPSLETKGLVGGSNISVTSINADTDLQLDYTGTTASDVTLLGTGTGVTLASDTGGPTLATKDLIAGTGITLNSTATDVTIVNDLAVDPTFSTLTTGTLSTDTINSNTGSTVTFPGDIHIQGNAIISGTTTSIDSQQLNVADRYIYLNNGNVTATSDGGMVINVSASGTAFTLSGNFTAGVVGVSNPTVGTVAASGLTVGQFIQISGSTTNDGIYEVLSHTSNVLTVRGVGLTATVQPWSQTDFTSEPAAGSARVVELSVIRSRLDTPSEFEYASGTTSSLTFTTFLPTILNENETVSGAFDLNFSTTNNTINTTNLTTINGNGGVDINSSTGSIDLVAGTNTTITSTGILDLNAATIDADATNITLDATNNIGVTGVNTTITGSTTATVTGATTTVTGTNTTVSGSTSVTLSQAAGNVIVPNIPLDNTATRNLVINGSDQLRYQTIVPSTTPLYTFRSGVTTTTTLESRKVFFGEATSVSGIANFFLTTNGLSGGPAIFSSLATAFFLTSGRADTTSVVQVPFTSMRRIVGNTVEVNVKTGNSGTIVVGGSYVGLQNAPDGSIAYLYVVGT